MKNFIILLFMSCAVVAFGQGTAKDTVTVLSDAEVTTGTLNDTLKMYYIQGGAWKKSALSAFRTFYVNNVNLASEVTGTLPITNGGTGQTTANAALNALLPSQTGNSGEYLFTDGTNTKWTKDTFAMVIAMSDETTNLTTGAAKVTLRAPFAMTITGVRANVNTAPVGSTIIVDINEAGTTILGTKLSIDASEKTSVTAASAATITDSTIANDAEMTIDIDQIGSSTAGKGLKVHIYYIKG